MPRTRPTPPTGDRYGYTADSYADESPFYGPGFLGYGPDDRPHYRHAPRASRI